MSISQNDIDSVVSNNVRWTTKFLPKPKEIPPEFSKNIYEGTIYNRVINAWYTGDPIPAADVSFNPGFKQDGLGLKKFIMAHLCCFEPEHEHKIAGCAYLLSQIITMKE